MRITILFIFILISSIFSQISQGGSPKGIDIRNENTMLAYDLESVIDMKPLMQPTNGISTKLKD